MNVYVNCIIYLHIHYTCVIDQFSIQCKVNVTTISGPFLWVFLTFNYCLWDLWRTIKRYYMLWLLMRLIQFKCIVLILRRMNVAAHYQPVNMGYLSSNYTQCQKQIKKFQHQNFNIKISSPIPNC